MRNRQESYASGSGSEARAGVGAHAAATIECMDCHGFDRVFSPPFPPSYEYHWEYEEYPPSDCTACHHDSIYEITARGFGLTDYPDDTGERAAHLDFVLDAINASLMKGTNEACIACHTRIGVNITWTKNTVLKFTAEEDDLGNWTLMDFQATGDNVTNTTYKNNWTNSY